MTDEEKVTGEDSLSNSNDDSIYVDSEEELEEAQEMSDEEFELAMGGGEGQEFDALMNQYLDEAMGSGARAGQLITVPVVAIKSDHVLVDVGGKSEGIIAIQEFCQPGEDPGVQVGQELEVVVRGTDHDSGLIRLSYQEARRRKAGEEVEKALKEKRPVSGKVVRTVKGGLIIDIGTTAFLPASQVDLHRVDDFEAWIGKEVEGYIIEYKPEKRRIIVSRRRLLEEKRDSQRQEVMAKLTIGEVVEVPVKRIVDFGVFVDLGGIDGLVPRGEISWDRNVKPDEYFKVDDKVTLKIIEVDVENGRVTLSRREILGNPWADAADKYAVGSMVEGKVVSLTNYGAFVRICEGLDGMIHISDMGWDSTGKRPNDYLQVGQEVSAQVLEVDCDKRRISLGLKQLTKDPWEDLEARYPSGTRIKGPVTGLTKYGAFVELEAGIEGMIHVSDFSWEKRINQPKDVVQKGDEVEAVVLSVDREKRRIALGVKQLSESPFVAYITNHQENDVVDGTVSNVTDFGVFVRLSEKIEGFMHVSQAGLERSESLEANFKEGESIRVKITKIDKKNEKISLSRRQMLRDQERDTIRHYQKKANEGWSTGFGELLSGISLEDDLPANAEPIAKPKPEVKADPEPEVTAPAEEPPITEPKAPADEPVLAETSPEELAEATPEPAAEAPKADEVIAEEAKPEETPAAPEAAAPEAPKAEDADEKKE